ncbi:hypothetical protein SBC2_83580 (plasmid) [Caballeronia sp. SBC2]|nr:hypothetical protein SBC2_83580 [Caballeronia sp. SBC2]
MFRTIASAAIILTALHAAFTHADDLSSAVNLQKQAATQKQRADAVESDSQAVRDGALLISKDILFSFFQQAQKAGIGFEEVNMPARSSLSGVEVSNSIVQSAYGGKFVYDNQCTIFCEMLPIVKISGVGEVSLSISFNSADGQPSVCNDTPNMSCMCAFHAWYLGDIALPCADVFNKAKRAQVTNKVVAVLNAGLVDELKRRHGPAAQ